MSSFLSFINDKRVRDWFYQIALILLLVGLTVFFVRNASENMVKAGIASGFDFLWRTSGIEVPFVLTGYTQSDDIFALFWVGVANTMLVTVIAIVLATVLGFAIGIARLSSHWLLSTIAGAYIEFVRNIPLLFFVLFWYFGVIAALPQPRQSIGLFGVAFLNNRGLTMPLPDAPGNFRWAALAIFASWLGYWLASAWARRRKDRTGQDAPLLAIGIGLIVVVPALAIAWASLATRWDIPCCAASTIAAASSSSLNSSRCSPRSSPIPPDSSPRSCAAASNPWRGARPRQPRHWACAPAEP